METEAILSVLPWRQPFLMIDRMITCTRNERILTQKVVTTGDPVVRRQGGGESCFPGMLLLEGMSQSAALLFRLSYEDSVAGELPMLGYVNAALHGSALPGESITYDVRSLKMTRRGGVFQARALLGEELIAEAELAFVAAEEHTTRTGEGDST